VARVGAVGIAAADRWYGACSAHALSTWVAAYEQGGSKNAPCQSMGDRGHPRDTLRRGRPSALGTGQRDAVRRAGSLRIATPGNRSAGM